MSTKHVILGLLDIRPMSGYDLAQNLKRSLESLWSATYGQIYPLLHQLHGEGLVTSELLAGAKKSDRIVYSLTELGRAELQAWINRPITYLPYRNPFMLWATYLDVGEPSVIFANIDQHIALQKQRAETFELIAESIENETHPLIQARRERLSADKVARLKQARALIFREMAACVRQEQHSAEQIRQLAQQLYPDD